jgi:hypothetical protein
VNALRGVRRPPKSILGSNHVAAGSKRSEPQVRHQAAMLGARAPEQTVEAERNRTGGTRHRWLAASIRRASSGALEWTGAGRTKEGQFANLMGGRDQELLGASGSRCFPGASKARRGVEAPVDHSHEWWRRAG